MEVMMFNCCIFFSEKDAIYVQNVTILPCKMANNVKGHLEFCKARVKHSDKHVHRIVTCIEQITVN